MSRPNFTTLWPVVPSHACFQYTTLEKSSHRHRELAFVRSSVAEKKRQKWVNLQT